MTRFVMATEVLEVEQSLNSLDSLYYLIREKRASVRRENEGHRFIPVVLFGRYCLDEFNQVWEIHKWENPIIPEIAEPLMHKDEFLRIYGGYECHPVGLPSPLQYCDHCGCRFSVQDLKEGTLAIEYRGLYHKHCLKIMTRENEIARVIDGIVYMVYPKEDIRFNLLPNAYDSSLLPWFLIDTPQGEITIGWRNRVFQISWGDNFKPFDMDIFKDENVTQKEYLIHAWGKEKAIKYLTMARDAVKREE